MKALVKLVVEFVGWRWAPAVALLTASMLYVLVVVGLVPSEIGVPGATSRLGARLGETSRGSSEATTNTYVATTAETTTVSAPARPMRSPVPEFGRRGFSPRIDRPDSPTPPAPIMTATLPTRGPLGGIFSRIQGALRPGSPAAQAIPQGMQNAPRTPPPPSALTSAAVGSPAPPVPAPAPAPPAPAEPAPAEGAAPAAPDNGAAPGAAPASPEAPPGAAPEPGGQPTPPAGAAPQPEPEPAPAQ